MSDTRAIAFVEYSYVKNMECTIAKVLMCLVVLSWGVILIMDRYIQTNTINITSSATNASKSLLQNNSVSAFKFSNNNIPVKRNSSSRFMTIDQLAKMGNNMNEYATLRGLAAMTGHTPVLSNNFQGLFRTFNLQIKTLPKNEFKTIEFKKYSEHWGTACANITMADVAKMGDVNIRLHGWFESYRYFEAINDVIRAEFTFKDKIKASVKSFFNGHIHDKYPKNTTTIGIHIRQGDMKNGMLKKRGWILPPISYFNKAMDYFRSKYHSVVFILCSDDLKWVENTFVNNMTRDVVVSRGNPGPIDLAILSSCGHVIISRGTFSWWAGWLTAGTTIYYKYYHPKGSLAAAYHQEWSYIPKDDKNNWIALEH